MTMKTYHGSCHCGRVRYEADIDFDAGTGRCNCSICSKQRAWSIGIKPEQFRLIEAGEQGDYQFGTMSGHHRFCKHCGIRTFGDGYVEQIGGAFVSINIASLDDITPEELAALTVNYANGRDNAWWNPPAVTSYL